MERTIILVHGLWITAASWEPWAARYRAAGHEVLAPPYPGMERSVAELRTDPAAIATLTTRRIAEHYAGIASAHSDPILVGHSFGGLIVQLLLDRGLGAAGVAICSAGPRGIRTVTRSQVQSMAPALRRPSNRRGVVRVTPEAFATSAANALSPAEASAAYAEHIVPAAGRLVFDLALSNVAPRTPLRLDFDNPGRPPLLLIGGGEDRMAPPRYTRELARRHAAGGSITAYKDFPGRSHYVLQPGWEAVADFALDWALAPAAL